MCFLLWGIQIKEEGCQGMAGRGTTCVVQSVLSSIASFSPNLFYFNKTNKINNKNDKRHASNSWKIWKEAFRMSLEIDIVVYDTHIYTLAD